MKRPITSAFTLIEMLTVMAVIAILASLIVAVYGFAQKKAALAESRLGLDREKFCFNAARQALIHFAELAKIARNRTADDEAKIKAAADLLFQPAPKIPANSAISVQSTSQQQPSRTGEPNS